MSNIECTNEELARHLLNPLHIPFDQLDDILNLAASRLLGRKLPPPVVIEPKTAKELADDLESQWYAADGCIEDCDI